MGNVSLDSKILCPFYDKSKSGTSFSCESILSAAVSDTIVFESAEKKRRFLKNYCFYRDGNGCKRASTLFAKYEKKV